MKQYYFRQSERGLLAWDVDRLVELDHPVRERRSDGRPPPHRQGALENRGDILAVQFTTDSEPDYVGRRPEELPY